MTDPLDQLGVVGGGESVSPLNLKIVHQLGRVVATIEVEKSAHLGGHALDVLIQLFDRQQIAFFVLAAGVANHAGRAAEAGVVAAELAALDFTGPPAILEGPTGFFAAACPDPDPDAILRDPEAVALIDRLLASKHYGERMAVYWLDVVRFADTNGYHSDNTRNHAPYRDYVIAAFNDNKPFDVFAREQIAGDLIPKDLLARSFAGSRLI